MKITKKIAAVTVLTTAVLGISSNASAHSDAAIAAIAVGGLIVGSALAAAPAPAVAPAPVAYTPAPAYYAPAPVYYATPVYYYPAPVHPRPHYYGYR